MDNGIERIEVTWNQIFIHYKGDAVGNVYSRNDYAISVTDTGVIKIENGTGAKLIASVHKIDYIEFND